MGRGRVTRSGKQFNSSDTATHRPSSRRQSKTEATKNRNSPAKVEKRGKPVLPTKVKENLKTSKVAAKSLRSSTAQVTDNAMEEPTRVMRSRRAKSKAESLMESPKQTVKRSNSSKTKSTADGTPSVTPRNTRNRSEEEKDQVQSGVTETSPSWKPWGGRRGRAGTSQPEATTPVIKAAKTPMSKEIKVLMPQTKDENSLDKRTGSRGKKTTTASNGQSEKSLPGSKTSARRRKDVEPSQKTSTEIKTSARQGKKVESPKKVTTPSKERSKISQNTLKAPSKISSKVDAAIDKKTRETGKSSGQSDALSSGKKTVKRKWAKDEESKAETSSNGEPELFDIFAESSKHKKRKIGAKAKIFTSGIEEDPYDFEAYLSTFDAAKKPKTKQQRPKAEKAAGVAGLPQKTAKSSGGKQTKTPAHMFFIQPCRVKRKGPVTPSDPQEPSPSIADEIVEFTLQPPSAGGDGQETAFRPARAAEKVVVISTPRHNLTALPLMRPSQGPGLSPITAAVLVESSRANSPTKALVVPEKAEESETDKPETAEKDESTGSQGKVKARSKEAKKIEEKEFDSWLVKFNQELSEIESFQLSIDRSQ